MRKALAALGVSLSVLLLLALPAHAALPLCVDPQVDFMAVGNGVADDTAPLNASFASAQASGKPICFGPGIFRVSNLTATGGFTMTGAGAERTTIRTFSGTGNVLSFTSSVDIAGIGFKTEVTRTSGAYVFFDSWATNSSLSHFYMSGYFEGAKVSALATVRISDGAIRDGATGAGTVGILISGGNDHYVDRVTFDAAPTAMPESGIRVDSVGCLNLTNLDIIHHGYDLWVRGGFSIKATQCWFDTAVRGIFVQPTFGPVGRLVFASCWTSSHTGNGILITNGAGGGVGSVEITSHQAIDNSANGLAITGGSAVVGVNVHGGLFSHNTGSGIYVGPGVGRIGIEGVDSGDVPGQLAGNGAWGIFVDSGAGDYIRVTGNDCHGNGAGGWQVNATGAHQVVSGNLQ